MADIKDFFSYKNKSTQEAEGSADALSIEDEAFEEQLLSHRRRFTLRFILAIIGVLFLIAIFYISWRDRVYSESRVIKNTPLIEASSANYIALEGHVLQYSKDGANLMDENGTVIWNQTYQMQNPFTATSGKTVAIGDYNGRTIYVANTQEILGEIDTSLPIRDFCVSSQGVVAAVLDDVDVTWIHLYDSKGEQLVAFHATMTGSGYPISVSISPDGTLVAVSFVGEDGGGLKDTVAFYNFGDVGQNATDHYVSGYDYPGAVVPMVQFMNGDSAFAVSDDRMMFYKGKEVPTIASENLTGTEEIRSVFYDKEHVAIVYANATGEGTYRLQLYNTQGTLVTTKYFSLSYTDIALTKDGIVVYNDSEWQLMDFRGNDKYHGVFEEKVTALFGTHARDRFLVVTQGKLQMIELR